MFRHVVLFTIRDDVSADEIADTVAMLRDLGRFEEVEEWTVEISLDSRKGRVIIELGDFADEDAFTSWRARTEHRRAAAHMAQIADWVVGDWVTT